MQALTLTVYSEAPVTEAQAIALANNALALGGGEVPVVVLAVETLPEEEADRVRLSHAAHLMAHERDHPHD